jgi:hypothetical protein
MLFDLDESLVDQRGRLIADLNEIKSPDELLVTVENLFVLDKLPYMCRRIDLIRGQTNWWRDLPQIEAGMHVFRAAQRMGFVCEVLTRAPKNYPHAWTEKHLWCERNLGPDIEVKVVKADKSGVRGDVLYDDYPLYGEAWLARHRDGLWIMPATYHNQPSLGTYKPAPNIIRYDNNLEEVLRALSKRALMRLSD